jgi:uncharacterized protein YndB with AHSA1/START domain
MTGNPTARIIGVLRSMDGTGVVRIEDRYDTDPFDLWAALTEPARLARWYGEVSGDLTLGGAFRTYLAGPDLENIGQVDVCDAPRQLRVTLRETDESYARGEGPAPHVTSIEVTLTPAEDKTDLVIEVRGLPLKKIAAYGAGWQIHAENLAAHVTGQDRADTAARWGELQPSYNDLAADLS